MAAKANRLKSESNETPSASEKNAKKQRAEQPLGKRKFGFLGNENFIRITGLFMLLFSLFLTFAFLSHLFNWQTDQDKVKDAPFLDFIADPQLRVNNNMGKFGAYFAHVFFHNWFGIASFLIPFCLFLVSFRMFFGISLLPLKKTLAYSLFTIIFVSLCCSFLFADTNQILGGGFGFNLYTYLNSVAGNAGVGLLLVFSGMSFLMLGFNFKFHLPVRAENKSEEKVVADAFAQSNVLKTGAVLGSSLHEEDDEQEDEDQEEDWEEKEEEEDSDSSITEAIPLELINKGNTKPVVPTLELTVNEPEEDPTLFENNPLVETEVKELTDEEKERMNLTGILSENSEFDLGEYDPTLDLSEYQYPGMDLLDNHGSNKPKVEKAELEANSNRIIDTLKNYGIEIARISASVGPTVTLYEIVPAAGVRISKIKNLEDDIALSLSALGIRIIAPMPGKGTIGIEVPNQNPEIVAMKTLLMSEKFLNTTMDLPVALGKTISNENFVADLAKMPHLLMAGATGQGKSVGLNAILVSLLYKKHPSQIKFVLVDPKKVELTLFNKIERHFLAKLPNNDDAIITDVKKVVYTLNSLCILMDQRYELLKMAMVRNIKEYNAKFIGRKLNPKLGHHFMPYIVLVVDEFADLIMTAGKEVELPIARLAQLARAIGIHLIIATQRPSVNIITGTIKANFPARVAFRVTSKIDSRTILDSGGADQLIGRGDMLFSTGSDLIRLQCPFVDTPEVDRITEFIGNQRGYSSAFVLPEYIDENAEHDDEGFDIGDRDAMFNESAHIVVMHQQGSASLLQRKLKLGYNRAGRIVDQLEKAGIIGPFEGSKARKVLVKDALSLEQLLNGNNQS
jgi:S-DNA-T family DNA segregation ATPase FtsK/SpoIIIE